MSTAAPLADNVSADRERSDDALPDPARRRRQRLKLLLILAVCASPVLASYFVYYVVRPQGRTNHGDLIDPQRQVAAMGGRALGVAADGGNLVPETGPQAGRLAAFAGRWVMLTAVQGPCDKACAERLWVIRQVRLTTGKDQDRIERVLLLSADAPVPPPALLAEHPGLQLIRADAALDWLPVSAAGGDAPSDHIYIVDPHGNLMMRFARDADPSKMKKDVARLLRASRIG
ncbi:MAG TPA: cytochrome C oxidase subunit I [Burkholderiaceae bacterium]|nr:cytochrome C oxidase subunit I [Burkholderiaceae bacterium]